MVTNDVRIDAAPEEVFDVVASGWSYSEWVVGARVRRIDRQWPTPGTELHHTFGFGTVRVDDSTRVLEIDRPRRLVLHARARPFGTARVELLIQPDEEGARVVMREELELPAAVRSALEPLLWARNAEALRRLRERCETVQRSPGPAPWAA